MDAVMARTLQDFATRIANAEAGFVEILMFWGDIPEPDAQIAMRVLRENKIVKFDPVTGEAKVKNGAFLEKQPIRNAVALGKGELKIDQASRRKR